MSTDDLTRSAVHEAGHAIAAHTLGARVQRVTLTHVSYQPPETASAALTIVSAGLAAELVAFGAYDEFAGVFDLGRVARSASVLWGAATSVRHALDRELARAAELLRVHWPSVEAVQAALLRAGELSASRFARIAGGVTHERRPRRRRARPLLRANVTAYAAQPEAELSDAARADLRAGLDVLGAWAVARGDGRMLARVERWRREQLSDDIPGLRG